MTLEEAYNTLGGGVTSNDSELKIKKRYKQLARKYHPDLYEQKSVEEKRYAEEMLKKINLAYETIKKAKNNSFKNEEFKDNLEHLKKEKLEKINTFFDQQGETFLKNLYEEHARIKINELTDLIFEYSRRIQRSISKENINNYYYAWTIHIKNYLEQVKKDYFKKNDILETEENLNNHCTFNEFIKELERQKAKNESVWKKIEKATEKYEYYAGYDKLAREIEIIKRQFEKQIIQKKKEQEILLEKMHQNIAEKFNGYYEDKAKWQDLVSVVTFDDVTLEEAKDLMMLQNILGTDYFKRKYQELTSIKNKVNYKKKVLEIQKMYLALHEKARKEIEKVSFTADLNIVYKINKILEFVWKIIEKAKNGWIGVEHLNRLQEITFQNFSNDMKILYSFRSNVNAKDIYIEKEEKQKEEADQIRWLQVENDQYYMYSYRPEYIPEIEKIKFDSMEKIDEYYISLNTFLENAQPIFYETNLGTTLYGYPKDDEQNYYCYLESDEDIIVNVQIFPFQSVEVIKNFNKKHTKYKEKKIIIDTIVKQINTYQDNALREELEQILMRKR